MCLNHPELVHKQTFFYRIGQFPHLCAPSLPYLLLPSLTHPTPQPTLSHLQAFGVVRLYQTFSMYSVTGETRSAGCFCKSSGWFKHIEPHRTYSNHNITEIARCGEVCHMSSGWFDCTEPSLATSLQGKQGVHGA